MTGESINYADILNRYKCNRIQAANDLERFLLRDELPAPGSVARAVVTLRSEGQNGGTDNYAGTKTADEMFRDAGYHEIVTRTNEKWYKKKLNDYTITLIIDFDTKCVDCRIGRSTTPMEFSEVLACAQLIREMEENNGENC